METTEVAFSLFSQKPILSLQLYKNESRNLQNHPQNACHVENKYYFTSDLLAESLIIKLEKDYLCIIELKWIKRPYC